MAMISVFWTKSIESLKTNCIKKQTLFGKKEAGSRGEIWFITAVPAVQVFLFSDFILIKGGGAVDFGQAFHCRSPSMSQVPHLTVHPVPFTGSAIFFILMDSRKKKWCIWLLVKFFSSMKKPIQLPLAWPPKKAVLPELFSCQQMCMFLGVRLFLLFLSAEKIPLLLDAGWILALSIRLCVHPASSFPSSTWICLAQEL